MNPIPTPPVQASPACARLAKNRERLADWLVQDCAAQAHPSLGGWAFSNVLPLLNSLRHHPTVSLALGTLARRWLTPTPAGTKPPTQAQPIGAPLALVRSHPKTSLALVALAGTAILWRRSRPRPPPT